MNQTTERPDPKDAEAAGGNVPGGKRDAYLYSLFEYNPFTTIVVDRHGRIVDFNAAKKNSGDRLPVRGEVMYRDYAGKHGIDMHVELMGCIASGVAKSFPELHYDSKTLSVHIAPFPDGAIIVSQDVTEAKRAERNMMALIDQLRQALHEIELLRELLPICASCKRIRDDSGYWNSVEEYFGKRSGVNFSHTLCPECIAKLYPDVKLTTPPSEAESASSHP